MTKMSIEEAIQAAIDKVAKKHDLSKKIAYEEALKLKEEGRITSDEP